MLLSSCLAISKGIKAATCNINNFSIVTSIRPKYIVHNSVVPKISVEKFNFSERKIEKVKLFTQSLTKFSCISVLTLEVA